MCYFELKIRSETTISTVNSRSLYICWNLDVTFTLCQVRSHGDIQGQCPKFFGPRKVCFKHTVIKTNILFP